MNELIVEITTNHYYLACICMETNPVMAKYRGDEKIKKKKKSK